jgi:hypothetical protein
MIEVLFTQSGVAYGYGYSAGEFGFVKPDDADRLEKLNVIRKQKHPAETRETASKKQPETT